LINPAMRKHFRFAREDQPGDDWLARFVTGREEATRWYLGEGMADPPTADECRNALRRHMPELMPQYERVCARVGDDDLAHRILSHYRPAPIREACSQAVWLGNDGPALVRNYDFPFDIVSDRFESTSWFGREVIAKAQRPWGGCLDGMNEDGLVASLTFGGSVAQGRGFSVILMLRYVLETCRRVDEAIRALVRIPIATAQNVTLLDETGAYATLFLGPDRAPALSDVRACTNHQERAAGSEAPAAMRSRERQRCLLGALHDRSMTLPDLVARFLAPPVYSRRASSPTVYTAVYWPAERRAEYIWPGRVWRQHIGGFVPGEYIHDYGELIHDP
jgi:predicted choloylglycine hydrolase